MRETRSRTSCGPIRFMGGSAISVNSTAPSSVTLSVSKTIGESPRCEGRLGPPAAAKCMGTRPNAPAAAEVARTLRRVTDGSLFVLPGLLVQPVSQGTADTPAHDPHRSQLFEKSPD